MSTPFHLLRMTDGLIVRGLTETRIGTQLSAKVYECIPFIWPYSARLAEVNPAACPFCGTDPRNVA